MHDISEFIRSLQARQHEIIIGGDWNDHISATNSTTLRMSTNLNLVDPWLQHYPNQPNFPPTYGRGSNRIDSFLISHWLLKSVGAIGYSPVGFTFNSDHRTIVIKMSRRILFLGNKVTVPNHESCTTSCAVQALRLTNQYWRRPSRGAPNHLYPTIY
jgi:hypothetical protein